MTLARLLLCAILPAPFLHGFARLTPETNAAFDRYAEAAEARMKTNLQPEHFLQTTDPAVRANLRGGELRIESRGTLDNGKQVKVPDGMIQDCLGIMFIPGATIAQVKAVLQDYENYKQFYKPEVTESKQLSHQGDEYDVFLRLYKKHVLTAVLNSNYHVRYGMVDARHMYVTSHSTRIAEVKKDGELPVGNDSGFLWRLNSYWRFEEADGGVYAECEAISLSRDVPFGLGWMIKGFLEKLPKESMLNTLRGTKSAVQPKIR
ncbi:MAG TPA: hypothetical protein VEU96_27220 [Bryobacteraceae bacterium]|nr:hypothetical protein [Bryobacteraceae bacterium]